MRKLLIFAATAALCLPVAACGGSNDKSDSNDIGRHIHHGQVYQSTDGGTYASTYDPTLDAIVWYFLLTPQNTATVRTQTPVSTTSSSGTTASWGRVTSSPATSSLTPVAGKSVEFNDKGEPQGQEEDTPEGEEPIDADTAPEQAQADVEAENTEADQQEQDAEEAAQENSDSSSDDSGSSDSSGDSGGGDSGGGDSGGGDAGGGFE